jgi:hypothetical protein
LRPPGGSRTRPTALGCRAPCIERTSPRVHPLGPPGMMVVKFLRTTKGPGNRSAGGRTARNEARRHDAGGQKASLSGDEKTLGGAQKEGILTTASLSKPTYRRRAAIRSDYHDAIAVARVAQWAQGQDRDFYGLSEQDQAPASAFSASNTSRIIEPILRWIFPQGTEFK